ncbi:hypothetical protein GQ53DRAFT_841339 [Thozetella sp. PMI_491]|nr:hypothetical protein GQ53DRAFT_841339 [Thozetella sp. PMI_491]
MNRANPRGGYGYDAGRLSPSIVAGIPGKTFVEGYRKEILNGFEREKPRYNPMNPNRPQSSPLVDLRDPIQVHLLTETALTDSKRYEILSQEEVDTLKKQIQSLTLRIEQTRANLAIQSKYRDAAISMTKLYSPTRPDSKRRSLLGNRLSGGDASAKEAELERQASERRCEELATELYSLEKRVVEPERRLLRHTAAILQMTHRTPSKKSGQPASGQQLPNGIPGSPESLYTYSNGRNSLDPQNDDAFPDDWNLYQPGSGGAPKPAAEIPSKSLVQEQNTQLRDEADRLKGQNADQFQTISDTQSKLENLNGQLRDVIIQFNSARGGELGKVPSGPNSLKQQLQFLEMGLAAAAEEQAMRAAREADTAASRAAEASQVSEAAAKSGAEASELRSSLAEAERRAEALSRRIKDALEGSRPDHPAPPAATGMGLGDQFSYLEDSLRTLEAELSKAVEFTSSMSANKQNNEQVETILMGLWDIIQSGYAGIQQQKAERRKTRTEKGLEPDDEDMSGDEMPNIDEPYSLSAFSTKVQWLYAQATSLKEEKGILKRQIKQQRELNSKSGSEKELELKSKIEEVEKMKGQLTASEKQVKESQGQLTERNTKIAALEASGKEAESKLAAVEASVSDIKAQLAQATEAKATAEESAKKLEKDAKQKDEELEQLNVMVIELKTELTFAKAELDGAYGSRRERAAEAAALSKSSETTELANQVEKLKTELASTLKEFEAMTKETLAAEREKIELESKLDDAVASRASLEAEVKGLKERLDGEVSNLREQLDAERLKVPSSPGPGSGSRAGATMLSEQFRATMKEERKKFQEEIREEQARRRKLEDEIRTLKKAAGPGRSPLGPLSPK